MQMKEVQAQLDISRRALQHYEEKGLIKVKRDENGYRNYTQEDVDILRKILIYRKLGIDIKTIATLLEKEDHTLLKNLLKQHKQEQQEQQKELEALETYIKDGDIIGFEQVLRYQSLALRFQEMLPGPVGDFFMGHFQPYLQLGTLTEEQERAYQTMVSFFDHVELKIPLFLRFSFAITKKLQKGNLAKTMDRVLQETMRLCQMDEASYEKEKEKIRKNVKLQQNILVRYHPAMISKRKFLKNLQDCGYNDILIPNMKVLSPMYREYHDALMNINNRITQDLGLHYDSHFQLVMHHKKDN